MSGSRSLPTRVPRPMDRVETPPFTEPAMLVAVESTPTLPTNRVVFDETTIVHVMEGAVELQSAEGSFLLTPGHSLAIGPGRWCVMKPRTQTRLWTVYVDERFLRTQMGWLLPDKTRVQPGIHPHDWDGDPLLLNPGVSTLRLVEPLWRQMSVLYDGSYPPEVAAARAVELFARWVGIVAPTFVMPDVSQLRLGVEVSSFRPIRGRLTNTSTLGQAGRAAQILRERMHEPWTVGTLAEEVALSRAHLTRLFTFHTGVAPMRFLTQVRLTEFTRLIEETDQSVAHAAQSVGWTDPRTASSWFHRRFGVTPSQYRLNPHPRRVDRMTSVEPPFPALGHVTAADSEPDAQFSPRSSDTSSLLDPGMSGG